MRIYVASPFGEMKRAKELMTKLEQLGYIITQDWTDEIFDLIKSKGREDINASADLIGVQRSDAVVLLVPLKGGRGMWIEFGYALALGRSVFVLPLSSYDSQPTNEDIKKMVDSSVFLSLAEVCQTENQLLYKLRKRLGIPYVTSWV